jgi:hypothetical protein
MAERFWISSLDYARVTPYSWLGDVRYLEASACTAAVPGAYPGGAASSTLPAQRLKSSCHRDRPPPRTWSFCPDNPTIQLETEVWIRQKAPMGRAIRRTVLLVIIYLSKWKQIYSSNGFSRNNVSGKLLINYRFHKHSSNYWWQYYMSDLVLVQTGWGRHYFNS